MSNIFIYFLYLVILTICTILTVKYCMLNGLKNLSLYFSMEDKTKGQIIGYITSLPELVIMMATAAYGIIDAGFWNIASSNIINTFLFLLAITFYNKIKCLTLKSFGHDIAWILVSILVPVIFFKFNLQSSLSMSFGLLLLFFIYKITEKKFTKKCIQEKKEVIQKSLVHKQKHQLVKGIMLLMSSSVIIIICGILSGQISELLILKLNISSWMVGWILGITTSIPEMGSFFEIFRINYQEREDILIKDQKNTQISIDILLTSNLSNLCLILPIGIIFAYIASSL